MSEPTAHDDDRQRRLDEVMAEYLLAADAGRPPDPDAFLARHPDLQAELVEFLADQRGLARLVEPLVPGGAAVSEDRGTLGSDTIGRTPDGAGMTAPEATEDWDHSATADVDLPRGTSVRYFGDYEINKELGRGGMGVVYEARQISLNRPVALKMIKAGLLADSDELRRFQNEAEAVALLDHPGIVPVYEVGEHDGQRYFSMKLVEGGSLVPLLARYKDDPKAAARLVAEAAEAVAHAHMRGILHRDLKPANLLVDDQGHPHVTDFGLAKKVEADVEFTASGAILGTPAYMSPEQANGRRGSITTATDVYGLGSVLYALLTGKAPFGGDSVLETLDAVRNAPPAPPTKLNATVPRDLETICLKCLEKDPRRRYPTASALADDLHAWLDSRPIAARRVGATERAWLWCKRKPVVAALAAAVVLVAVGGTAAVIAVQTRANRALERKNLDLQASNTRLDQQRTRAEDNERQAIDAVKRFRDAVTDNPDLKDNPSLESLRKTLLKEPLSFFKGLRERLQTDRDTKPESLARLAKAMHDYAHLTQEIGDVQDGIRSHEESLAIWEKLTAKHPLEPEYQSGLASIHNCRGSMLSATGQPDAARTAFEAALAIQQTLADAHPAVTQYQSALAHSHNRFGLLLSDTGEPDAARKAYEAARAIFQTLADAHPTVTQYQSDLAGSHNNLGLLLRDTGEFDAARTAYEAALPIRERLAREHPESPDYASDLGGLLGNMARLDLDARRFDAARARLRQAIVWQKKTLAVNPRNPTYRQFLADDLGTLIKAARALGRDGEAVAAEREIAELKATDPRFAALDARLAAVLKGEAPKDNRERLALAQRAYDFGRHALAARLWSEAIEADPKLADDRQAGHRYNAACAAALAASGQAKDDPAPDDAAKAKLRQQALDWLKAELALWAKFVASGPPQAKAFIAQTLKHWQEDTDLAGIRDAAALETLPEAERVAWRELWANVDALLAKARAAATPPPAPELPADPFAP